MSRNLSSRKSSAIVAEVCLYGTPTIGAGWLVSTSANPSPVGDHDPRPWRGFTAAVWAGVAEVRRQGLASGRVRIFAPGGLVFAEVELGDRTPLYGDLRWSPVSTEGLVALDSGKLTSGNPSAGA